MLLRMCAWRRFLGASEGVFESSLFEGVDQRRGVELGLYVPVAHMRKCRALRGYGFRRLDVPEMWRE